MPPAKRRSKSASVKRTKTRTESSAVAVPAASQQFSFSVLATALGAKGKVIWNVLSSLGPRSIALFRTGSANLLRHRLGENAISGWKDALSREIEDYSRVENEILKQIPDAKPEEFPEIQQKLEFVRALRCHSRTVERAVTILSERPEIGLSKSSIAKIGDESHSGAAISEHWMDHFNRLARQRNEPWREQLLARALIGEAEIPGSISPRLLWLLGTLEAAKFEHLAALLDLAATIEGIPVVPGDYVRHSKITFDGKKRSVGALAIFLSDVGLVEDENVVRVYDQGETFLASYENENIRLICDHPDGKIGGVRFTSLGIALATLYDASPNEDGRSLFKSWRLDLLPSYFKVVRADANGVLRRN